MHISRFLSLLSLVLLTAPILGTPIPVPADDEGDLDNYAYADETDDDRPGLGYDGGAGRPGIGPATNRPNNGNAQIQPTPELQPGVQSDGADAGVPGGAGASDGAADPGSGGHGSAAAVLAGGDARDG